MKLTASTLSLFVIALLTYEFAVAQKHNTAGLRGQVYAHQHGMLLPETKVQVLSAGKVVQSMLADESGSYKFFLPVGNYTVSAALHGFRYKETEVELKSGEQILMNIGLEVGPIHDSPSTLPFIINGVVKQADNKPLRDATITLISSLDQQVVAKVTTDSKGRYRLPVVIGNQFVVLASKPGFVASAVPTLLPFQWSPKRSKTIDFVLEKIVL